MAKKRRPRKKGGKNRQPSDPFQPVAGNPFSSAEPTNLGYVLKSFTVPFDGEIRQQWLAGNYSRVWELIRDRLFSSILADAFARGDMATIVAFQTNPDNVITLQSVRLVINGFLQKRALKADVADFEQYMLQLVRVSPKVTDGISGFSLRVVYKQEFAPPEPKKSKRTIKKQSKRKSKHGTKRKMSRVLRNRKNKQKSSVRGSSKRTVSKVSRKRMAGDKSRTKRERGPDGRFRKSSKSSRSGKKKRRGKGRR